MTQLLQGVQPRAGTVGIVQMVVHRPTGAAANTDGQGSNEQNSHEVSPVLCSVSTPRQKSSRLFIYSIEAKTNESSISSANEQ
jgi:hypothetical protein